MKICSLCGIPAECTHHLIFGRGMRNLADEDCITIPLCNKCHNMATKAEDRIHGNSTAEKLSKMLGQALWEKQELIDCECTSNSEYIRDCFIKRYGRSYL